MAANPASEYDVVKELGKGAFGSVAKVVRKGDKKAFAMKTVQIGRMEEREVADALNECRILASIRHPRIVNFEAAFLAKNGRDLCLVMEICERGDLAGRIKKCQKMRRRVDERTIWANMVEMTEGLVHLHAKNISHRDLKPANIFLAADGTAKLGDLNVSKLTKGDDLMQTKIGTPYYMAPEVWAGKKYDEACDVWSLGTVIYELAALERPFKGKSLMQLGRAVTIGRYLPIPSSYSPELSRIIVSEEKKSFKQLSDHTLPSLIVTTNSEKNIQTSQTDIELMATIKAPKSKYEVRRLSEKLRDMSHTSRGDKTVCGEIGNITPPPLSRSGVLPNENSLSCESIPDSLDAFLPAEAEVKKQVPQSLTLLSGINTCDEPTPTSANDQPTPPPQPVRNEPDSLETPFQLDGKKVPSQSRPGAFSYLNTHTGERVAERPSRPASSDSDKPLPPGWKKVPSQSRPGEFAYLNKSLGMKIGWRPTEKDGSRSRQMGGSR
eukprot:CAMPEP_0114339260 /NCGR_PEP_ID=MMETSP0101-20121206/7619_1 /TAXON_ID=38822 ORGANISM="Pteridomonas danica, Strain PT" /NCGR_SAMPLE_ID=MMETSP0101 /ASSEMBLY_ACC=CAM_ASM_000211 /LENGTH=493 /DNA_ID=CAMNT_0001472185 /DNA_START=48 /DNA_END=1531 /DNA_ORIENTATION=-